LSSVASLIYDGTAYAGTKTISGADTIFNVTMTSPFTNSIINKTFYWQFVFINDTGTYYYNSTIYNQTVNPIAIGNCSIYSNLLINFSSYDEDTLARLTNNNYNIYIKIGDNTLTNYVSYSTNRTGANYADICLQNATTTSLRMDYIVQYTSNGNYGTEYYNVQNYQLNSSSMAQNISLYPLGPTRQEYTITVKDSNYAPLANAIVRIDRQYINIS
jgi:hypothetical protein